MSFLVSDKLVAGIATCPWSPAAREQLPCLESIAGDFDVRLMQVIGEQDVVVVTWPLSAST